MRRRGHTAGESAHGAGVVLGLLRALAWVWSWSAGRAAVAALVTLVAPTSASAQAPPTVGVPESPCVVWRGTLGSQPVAVRLERDLSRPNTWTGEYGVPHGGPPTPLLAHARENGWVVEEGGNGRGLTWSLEARGADRVGTWRSADGRRTAPVLLSCLVREDGRVGEPGMALLLGGGPPARQLSRLLRRGLTVETEVTFGSARYRNAVDLVMGRAYLQLTSLDPQRPPRPALLRELNERVRQHVAKVAQEQRAEREQFPECEVESTVEIRFASPKFLTLSTFDEWSCGSTHPEQSTTLETFDVSGERAVEVALDETYRLNGDPKTRRAFWKVVSAARGPSPAAARCAPDEAMGAHYELGLVQGGVLVDVDFGSFAASSCDFSVVLPGSALQRFATPSSSSARRHLRRARMVGPRE